MKKHGKSRRPKPKKRPAKSAAAPTRSHDVPGTVAVKGKPRRPPKKAVASAPRTVRSLAAAAKVWPFAGAASLDDRIALGLLLAPFLIVAVWLGAERTVSQMISRAPQLIAAAQPTATRAPPPPASVPVRTQRVASLDPALSAAKEPHRALTPPTEEPLPALALIVEPRLSPLALIIEPPAPPLPMLALMIEPPLAQLRLIVEPTLPAVELPVTTPLTKLPVVAAEPPPSPLPVLALLEQRVPAPAICLPSPTSAIQARATVPNEPAAFGVALAAAARVQTQDFVIYNPKYQRISYPMGDVPSLFGVCTDVIIRAYRALGIDLQALVQEMKLGTGDRNIDHRRVEVVRRLLTRHGTTLPISDLAEDYQPGDIVTYHRPQNRTSTSHIAIVSDRLAPSGRPMIVHNRGWGPELEDALFVDKITGHYRFTGVATASKGDATPVKRRVATK